MTTKVIPRLLRLEDLRERGIAHSRQAVRSLQMKQGFPSGFLLGARTRVWTEQEIKEWIEHRMRD